MVISKAKVSPKCSIFY